MNYYTFGGEEYIKLTELLDFASKEDNNKINIKGRLYASPVLCKDCKYWGKSDYAVWCRRTPVGIFRMEEDDFCSKGEKK